MRPRGPTVLPMFYPPGVAAAVRGPAGRDDGCGGTELKYAELN
ncbi:hypothetical protein SNL152K_638 [Streptomyces sp. NL15-2K]|nr:hypothetical protein SNL152K_638 [Streptomyces sp. NL15-2K]